MLHPKRCITSRRIEIDLLDLIEAALDIAEGQAAQVRKLQVPPLYAQQTLDRLVGKLAADVNVEDVRAYARGIARLVLLEWRRRPTPVSMDESRDYAAASLPMPEDDTQELSSCFERCLAALTDETRSLVLDYYVAERRAKIDNRFPVANLIGYFVADSFDFSKFVAFRCENFLRLLEYLQ